MSHGRAVIIDAGERSRRRAAEEAAKKIQIHYSGTPGEVSNLTLGQKGTWLAREVSLPWEVPDPSPFQSDSEQQGEEFEDAQSCQVSRNPEAGSAVTEGAYELVAARKQREGAREAEFDNRKSLILQVSVSRVQENIDAQDVSVEAKTVGGDRVSHSQRMKSYDPNLLGTHGLVTGNRDMRQGSAQVEGAADRKRTVSVEADTTGVINQSSGTDSGQPSDARGDKEDAVDSASEDRQADSLWRMLNSSGTRFLEDMAERLMFHYKEPEKFRGTSKENAIEWIDRFERIGRHNRWSNNDLARAIDVSLEGAAYKWIVGLDARNTRPEHREGRGLKTLFLKQLVAVSLKPQTERKLRMRVQVKEEDIMEYYHDVMDMCRIVLPDMAEEVRIDQLFMGLSPALYQRLYVLGIKSCEEFLEEAKLHGDAVKIAYERGYEDARRERKKPAVGAVGLDKCLSVEEIEKYTEPIGDNSLHGGDAGADKGLDQKSAAPKEDGKGGQRSDRRDEGENRWRNHRRKEDGKAWQTRRRDSEEDDRNTVGMVSADEDDSGQAAVLLIDSSHLITEGVVCRGIRIKAVIDTGAVVSVASPSLQEKLGARRMGWDGPSVAMVNGQKAPPLGDLELEIEHKGMKFSGKFERLQINYVPNGTELLLGELHVNVIDEQEAVKAPRLVTKTGKILPPRAIVPVEIEATTLKEATWMIEPSEHLAPAKEVTAVKVLVSSDQPLGQASPVVLVKKKDGSWRFCVDYRRLNAISIKDVFPLPRFEETLSRMGNASIFSTLDLDSGYWQAPLNEEDKVKTAFVTPDGLYQFLVMPFGLASAPGTFQRMMDLVLTGLRWTICLVYLDNIIIYASDAEEHLVRVRQVLTALRKVGFKIKLVKCQFGASEVKALGHVISGDGFAHTAKTLTDMFKKGGCFMWEESQEVSFGLMKQALVSAATLSYPDFTRPFEIHPDACDYGLGAVLLQRVNNIERPLAYVSCLLSPSESNYSITEKECLALVWAVKKFRSYILGMDTLVVTDHHALCWLLTKKDLAGRLACWSLQLQEFLLRIIHRKGRLHTDADAFFRYAVDAPQEFDKQLHCTPAAFSVDTESKSEFQSDHEDWDESLPFVTFAYDTSRHESTGRTPFYLVYGREAVLPIDGALNADPNLVPLPDRDPSEWAVERLQQARLEVQTRAAAVQKKQKKFNDEARSEATTYLPGEEVLIYKPIRKVGKSEKLLHRWLGPYTVIRQTTPSNYELRLGRTVKTEIVHVERMKPFVDCVSPGPVAAGEILAYQGVIFKSEGELAFSDSEWVLVTDFTFDPVDQVIKSLYERLDIRMNDMSDHYDGPKSQFKQALQQHVKERAQEELFNLRKIYQRWNELKTAVGVQESRVKRGLVDGGGRFLNWLFEVSTQEDLEHVNGPINKLSTETTSIVHALEVHASLINETQWETKASGDALAELQTAFARIE
ncbi:Uncharacterized protein APZ42_028148 [Daphnia magna]|uniref:RNA-directed DNA polymerase n=1 Tax=Daphnia magna TaxID=35525 RepID=A0A164QSB7_9CRUS|nr:Uncharacterized protein APZ42_028148 [Daphnia magna]